MRAPVNIFKAALRERKSMIGLWLGLAHPYSAEIAAGCGFDWLLIDGEHAPNDVRSTLAQLQAAAAFPSAPVVRVPIGEVWIIKQFLDIGAQNLMVPLIESAEQAQAMMAATRYPPHGVRGVGASMARASAFGRRNEYLVSADDEIGLILQVETPAGMKHLDAIAATNGVDGVFIGPSDLAATMGHLGNPGHPEVQRVIEDAIARILKAGKAPGILTSDEQLARRYLELGAVFVAVGTDVSVFARHLRELAARYGRKPF